MILERYLDELEESLIDPNLGEALIVECDGNVDNAVLNQAYQELYSRHPVLRARIRSVEQGHLLHVPAQHAPEFVVFDGDESIMRHEVDVLVNPECAVTRLVSIRCGRTHYVAIRFNHAIGDGRCMTALFDELWRLYTDIATGSDVSTNSETSLPVPPTSLLQQRWGRIHLRRSSTSHAAPGDGDMVELIQRRVRLTKKETVRLRAAASSHGTSIHGLLCGAILVSQRALAAVPGQALMMCHTVVDLRERVDPPVRATETTNFVQPHTAIVFVPASGNPIEVGIEIKTQLDSAIASRELSSATSRVETPLEQRLASVAVTNIGALPMFTLPAGLRVTDFVMTRPRRLPRRLKLRRPNYLIYTFEGRLNIYFLCSRDVFSSSDADEVVHRIREQLYCVSG